MSSSKETEPITTTTTNEAFQHEVEDDTIMETIFTSRTRCCSLFPCFGSKQFKTSALSSSSSSPSVWERLTQTAEMENRWWAGPLRGLKKAREWSEIIAGPKWKTFIRRFNHHHNNNNINSRCCSSKNNGKFQYDPLSYSLNFDEGQGYNGHLDDDGVSGGYFPDFSSRFASLPSSCKTSMDLGKTVIPLSG